MIGAPLNQLKRNQDFQIRSQVVTLESTGETITAAWTSADLDRLHIKLPYANLIESGSVLLRKSPQKALMVCDRSTWSFPDKQAITVPVIKVWNRADLKEVPSGNQDQFGRPTGNLVTIKGNIALLVHGQERENQTREFYCGWETEFKQGQLLYFREPDKSVWRVLESQHIASGLQEIHCLSGSTLFDA